MNESRKNAPHAAVRFDPLRRASSDPLKESIKAFTSDLETEERGLKLRTRKRRLTDRRNFRLAVEAIVCNLLVTAMVAADATLAVPRGHYAMWGKGRYRNSVYGQHFISILDLLEEIGCIETVSRGFRISAKWKGYTTIRPLRHLADFLPLGVTTWSDFRRERIPEVIILRPAKDSDDQAAIDYRETARTKQWRREMETINRRLESAAISVIGGPAVRLDRDGQPIDPHQRALYRVFNNGDWKQGGRLFGACWLTMARDERFRILRIDDEQVVNVDYMQLFPRLAYAGAQAEQPADDVYDVSEDGLSREGWKRLTNALLFAQKPLKQWPDETKQHFPESTSLRNAIQAINRKHEPIAPLFNQGIGFRLMRVESDMLISVVTALFKSGVTALPLHDAVLVARSQADTAKDFMQAEFERRTGSRCAIVKVEFPPV